MGTTIKEIEIKNIKIPVIFEEQKNLPILNIQLVFDDSGYIKDQDKIGLASLSAKLLNEGTKELGATKFAQKLDENAISLYSAIGFETLVIELSSLKEKNSLAIEFLKELLNSPNYTEDSLEKIKTLQTGFLKRKESDFDYIASTSLNSILFKNTPLANTSNGTTKSIAKIQLKDIKEFLQKSLVLNKLTIVAGGDISLDDLKVLIKPLLETLEVGEKNSTKNSIEFTSSKQEESLIKDTKQAYIYFGSNFNTDVTNSDNYKAKVASFILGSSGFGSRLMEEIRVKNGLAYSVYSSIGVNRLYSYFGGYLQTKNESYKEAISLVKQIIKEFTANGATKEELESAKKFILGSEPLQSETLNQRLNRAFLLYHKGLEQDYKTKELELIQNLTLEDLNSYIKSHQEINNLIFFTVRK